VVPWACVAEMAASAQAGSSDTCQKRPERKMEEVGKWECTSGEFRKGVVVNGELGR